MNEEDSHFAQVASGAIWNMLGSFLGRIISFIYTIYIARVIAQDDVGIFYLALSIIGILTIFKDFGLPYALARFVPFYEAKNEHQKAAALFKATLVLTSLLGAILTFGVWLLSGQIAQFYQNEKLAFALQILCTFVIIDNIGKTFSYYVVGKANMKLTQFVSNFQLFAKLIITFLFVELFGAGLFAIGAGYVLSYLISYPIFAPFVFQDTRLSSKTAKFSLSKIIREVAPFGLVITFISIFNIIMGFADRILLGYLIEPESAPFLIATYSFAISLANNLNILPGTISTIFFPVISRLVGANKFDKVRSQLRTAQRWVLFITMPFAAVMVAFSWDMLGAFFGQKYAEGGLAMSIFVLGLVFYIFASVISFALAGMQLVGIELKVAIIAAVVNVLLNILLIPHFGIEGAAAAAAAGFAVWGLLMFKYGKERIGFEPSPAAYRLLLLGFAPFALAFALKPLLGLSNIFSFTGGLAPYLSKLLFFLLLGIISTICAALFAVLSVVFKCFEREDAEVWVVISQKARLPHFFAKFVEKIILVGVQK